MKQLEIQYFFPLTEQIPLDLDHSTCKIEPKIWATGISSLSIRNSGTGLAPTTLSSGSYSNTIAFIPSNDTVGYWEICKDIQMHNKKRPSWVNRKLAKIFFGWVWRDK